MRNVRHYALILIILLICFNALGQSESDSIPPTSRRLDRVTFYAMPILDGAAFAIDYKLNKTFSINFYTLKRKALDGASSRYYRTKSNENLYELFLKIKPYQSKGKTQLFFGPNIGFRKIIYDENQFFFSEFGLPSTTNIDSKAKARYIVPMYFGFDYTSKKGLVFEFASGLSFQTSEGNTNISSPTGTPYKSGINGRSRFLIGYVF